MAALVVNPPSDYDALVDGAEAAIEEAAPDALPERAHDFIHWFCPTRAELARAIKNAPPVLAERGMLWISWPKKSSSLHADLTEDGVRELALPTGLVDVKVCAVDADWSGLKLVRRKT